MRAGLGVALVCFASTLVYCAGADEGETPQAEAIKANFDKLVSEDKEVKREALLYFGKVDKTFAAEVPLFTASLKDERNQVRAISAFALGKIGKAAAGSIPEVEKLLADSSATVQKYAKRALGRLRPFRPALKKLTAKEAADALALLIGEWEGKGQRKDKGSDWVPVSLELKDVTRWKEKGKSIEGTTQLVIDGKEEPAWAYECTYDPSSELFIVRGGRAGGELKLTMHRRYDPATRTFQAISFFPERPEGQEMKSKFSVTESGRISSIVEIYEDGKLWGEQKVEFLRLTAEEAAKAKLSRTPKSAQEEAIAAIKKLGGKVTVDKNKVAVKVHLIGTKVTDAGLVHLKGLTKLETLYLGFTKITDAGLMHLKGLTKLNRLWLHGTQVSDAGLEHLEGLTKLEFLDLNVTKVTDAGLVHLEGLTKLEELHLHGTKITGAGLVHLKGLTKLEWLNLNGTKITDAGLVHLEGLTKVGALSFIDTKVTAAAVKKLQQALPNCDISR